MTRTYTETDVVAIVEALTPDRLMQFVHLRVVTPVQDEGGPRYREIDVARITLLCELTDDFDLPEDAVVIVMSLLDQLHGARTSLATLMAALEAEEAEVRHRVARCLAG